MAQPYLMGMTKVIDPAQLWDKDLMKMSHIMVSMTPLVLISTFYILRGFLNICTIWAYWIDASFLMNHLCLPSTAVSKLPKESPEHTTPTTFREICLLHILDFVTYTKKPDVSYKAMKYSWYVCPCIYSGPR